MWKIAFLPLFCSTVMAQTVYFNDFEESVGPEWSTTKTNITPVGDRSFLGEFSNETVSLTVGDLPTHTDLVVTFDLFIIESWDGNGDLGPGPDRWALQIRNSTFLMDATFSTHGVSNYGTDFPQSYSDNWPIGNNYEAFTGAEEINTLGYYHSGHYMDSVYEMSFTFQHTNKSIILDFFASGLQNIEDESWGIDNISVETVPEPTTLLLLGMGGLLIRKRK